MIEPTTERTIPATCNARQNPLGHTFTMGSPRPLRCVIVDDNAAFIYTASRSLDREGIAVVGVASDIAEAVRVVASLKPDVTIVDVYLGAESGFDLAEQLAGGSDASPVILTSTHSEQDLADMITTSSALGFVSKVALSPDAIRDILGRT